jgi:hypothetical protein
MRHESVLYTYEALAWHRACVCGEEGSKGHVWLGDDGGQRSWRFLSFGEKQQRSD